MLSEAYSLMNGPDDIYSLCRGSVVAVDAAVPRRDQDGSQMLLDELMSRSIAPGLDPGLVLETGPDRHHASDRWKQGYRPY